MAVHYADPLASKISLKGSCNQCGMCCSGVAPDGVPWHCEHLVISPTIPLGFPMSTKCKVYESRRNGMRIWLLRDDNTRKAGQCFHNTWQEIEIILPHIGKACSLTMHLDDSSYKGG